MNIKIIIAAHKQYLMPDDDMYVPVHVGAFGKPDLDLGDNSRRDDSGDNISEKNPSFCELTGLYWAWKNLDCQWLGLAHYRRHFSFEKKGDPWKSVLSRREAEVLLKENDIILPETRKYYIETLYSHYAHTHDASHLDTSGKIISESCPEYKVHFDAVMKQTSGYMFNMYIMRKSLSDEYCSFLFPILSELENRIDSFGMSSFDLRYPGRISEIMFNVWLRKKLNDVPSLKTREIRYIYMEPVSRIKKGEAFLKAKFSGKKYDQSF